MSGEPDSPSEEKLPFRSLPLLQREVALLIVLCVISAIMFAGTRRMAGWSRDHRIAAAAQWYALGESLNEAGNLEEGIAALREAVAEERQNPEYVLTLARRLTETERHDEARQLLRQLRQVQPDDVEVNYGLARLAALDNDQAEAVRYYNYALYGVARLGVDYDRREIRTELITFLLDRRENQEAKIELEALERELPDEPEAFLEAASLAVRAGSSQQAFSLFTRAGELEPSSAEAAAGAGLSAFALRDFSSAVTSLSKAFSLGATDPELPARLEVARLVQKTDPLASRLASSTRANRLRAGLVHAVERYDGCPAQPPTEFTVLSGPLISADQETEDPVRLALEQLRKSRLSDLQDPDTLARGVALIGNVEATVRARCSSLMTPLDEAWELIAELHQGGQ